MPQNEELATLLDRAIDLALKLNMSDSNLMHQLLERYALKSEECRSVVHIDEGRMMEQPRMSNPEAAS